MAELQGMDYAKVAAQVASLAGGAAGVPYASYATAPFNVANIASSKMPDDRKAYETVSSLAGLVPAFGPVIQGALKMLGFGIFGNQHYARTRGNDAARVPSEMNRYMTGINTSFNDQELDEFVNLMGIQGGRFPGTHLNTSGLESSLRSAIDNRRAFINSGSPEFLQQQQQFAPYRNAVGTVGRMIKKVPGQVRSDWLTRPNEFGDEVYGVQDDWLQGRKRFAFEDQGRTSSDAPHVLAMDQNISDLGQASGILGIDFDAAMKRRAQRQWDVDETNRNLAGGGGE